MIKRLIILNTEDGCCDMMVGDLIILLRRYNMARYYVKSTIEAWNRREIYYDNSDYFFILFPHKVEVPFPENKYWLYFLEQNLHGNISSWYNTEIVGTLMLHSIRNFDYNDHNIKVWHKHIPELKITHLPLPISRSVTHSRHIEKKYDILFYGCVSNRRREILKKLQQTYPNYRYMISKKLLGDRLKTCIQESKIALNLHYYDGDSLLEQARLHELMRFNTFIISELPGVKQPDLVNNYRCCVDFVDVVEKDLSNISVLFAMIGHLLKLAESPSCTYNMEYKQLFAQHYPEISL